MAGIAALRSAGCVAGAAAGAGGRGGLLSLQPAGATEAERRFGAEYGVAQLGNAGILCQNPGHHGLVGHHGIVEIIHCQAPLCCVQGFRFPVLSGHIIHWEPLER